MHLIEIDDKVFAELSRRATGFNVTPNTVIRRVLNLLDTPDHSSENRPILAQSTAHQTPNRGSRSGLVEFVQGDRFQDHSQAIDRFLMLLGWLHLTHKSEFADVALGFRKGNRVYFAKSQKGVEQSGVGITAKPIPQSPYWVLTTLDNKSKRNVVEDLLRHLKYPRGDINLVLAELPDSGIRRGQGSLGPIDELARQYTIAANTEKKSQT